MSQNASSSKCSPPSSTTTHYYSPSTPSFGLDSDEIERQPFLLKQPQESLKANRLGKRRVLNDFIERLSLLYNDNIGLLLVIASQLFFTFMNLFVKLLTALDNPVNALELIWIRMFITYVCGIIYMLWKKIEYPFTGPPEIRWLLVIRGVSGFFGLFGMYYSLTYLSLSDATVLTFLAPGFTGIAGALILKEEFSRREAFAGLFSLAGVVLIARPSGFFGSTSNVEDGIESLTPGEMDVASNQRLVAVGVALVGVLGATGAYTSIRAIGTRAHALHSLTIFSLYCVIVSTIMMIVMKIQIVIPTQSLFLLFLVLIGVFGFIAQFLLVLGLQRETASRGTIGIYAQIIFAALLEQVVLHTKLSILSIIGTVIILSSALYVALTKQKRASNSRKTKRVHWEDDIEFQSAHNGEEEDANELKPLESPAALKASEAAALERLNLSAD